jgi:hypothetical protein
MTSLFESPLSGRTGAPDNQFVALRRSGTKPGQKPHRQDILNIFVLRRMVLGRVWKDHSYRRAIMGSTRIARRAGT